MEHLWLIVRVFWIEHVARQCAQIFKLIVIYKGKLSIGMHTVL